MIYILESNIMQEKECESMTLEDYKNFELQLHRELINTCRKYINYVGIISMMGVLDLLKQEITELEQATRNHQKEE